MEDITFKTRVKLAWLALTNPTALIVMVVQLSAGLMKAILNSMLDQLEATRNLEKQSYAPGGQKEGGE